MKNLLIVILIIILVGGIYYFLQKSKISTIPQAPTSSTFEIKTTQPTQLETSTLNITTTSPTTPTPTTATPTTEVIIKITANGFEPKEVEITKGTKVTWINEQPNPSWPASAVHPTHEVYPGSSIKKCGTPEQDKIFDTCRGLK
jgi:plastocyanin